MYDISSYQKADSIENAIKLLSSDDNAVLIAGGTDVLIKLREGKREYSRLIDINGLTELRFINQQNNGSIAIGAGTTFSDILTSDLINRQIPILSEMAASVAGPQIRNVATIGGNLCNGAVSADSAAPLLCLNAELLLQNQGGKRFVELEKFYKGPGKVDLRHGEILTDIIIRQADFKGYSSTYYKYAMREAMDIATIGCAGSIKFSDGQIEDIRLAYTVAGPVPIRCRTLETMLTGKKADSGIFKIAEEKVLDDLSPRNSWRAAKDFREHIIRVLAVRVLKKCLNGQGVEL